MWISRKFAAIASPTKTLDRLNKPLPPPDITNHAAELLKVEPLVIVVSGNSNIGKSTFIRFSLQNLIAKHDSNRPDLQCHHTKILLDDINCPIDIIELNGSIINEQTLPIIHAGLICYDTSTHDSFDSAAIDLSNYYSSRQIPAFFVGLKSDLNNNDEICQINKQALLLRPHFHVDAFSETGVEQMQYIFKLLVEQYYPRSVNYKELEIKTRIHIHHDCSSSSSLPQQPQPQQPQLQQPQPHQQQQQQQQQHEDIGFIYAPTRTIDNISVTSGSEADPDKVLTTENIASFPSSFHMTNNKRGTFPSHLSSSRRGSKDSSESFGIGLTTEDIIDRLLSTEYNKADENIIPIFLTFFRKFMKPNELVKILVERFENDGLSEALPTDLQKRIHSVFMLWLSHYWNDFYGAQARKQIILFLDRISKYESLTPICDSLAPLVVREPPSYDPDKVWGLVDDNDLDDEDDLDDEPTTPIKRNEKKDSGYASGTFTFMPSSSPPLTTKSDLPTLPPPPPPPVPFKLKRISPNLNRLLNKTVTHSESQPDLRSSYTAAAAAVAASTKSTNEFPRRAEFAGGLINIDNATTTTSASSNTFKSYASPRTVSSTISIATTSGTRWTSSLGHQLLASSFISTFRQNKSEKDQTSHAYKVFMKATDTLIANQLTWIESELFSKIKPREFIRNIWNTAPVNTESKRSSLLSCNNTVMASIAHFNFISAWVVTMIVTQSRLSKRVALLQKFMSIAVHLRDLNNYNSLMAILAGINSASVLRLKQTRHAVITKKIYKQFQSLEKLMSTDKSFCSYRMALKASSGGGAPGIPYLGIHTQDLVSLAEANKDFKADGSIHWEKFKLMGETIMATMKFKSPSYTIEPDTKLLALIADTYILTEDEQYKMSTTVEPRLASSSTNRIRDLWLRM